ncbi:MAG: hypothetical protein ACLP1X_18360 [Polyangiaceae bacterium]
MSPHARAPLYNSARSRRPPDWYGDRSAAARVEVVVSPDGLSLSETDVVAWVQTAVDAIAAYLGRFPVDRTLVMVQAGRPKGGHAARRSVPEGRPCWCGRARA